MKEREREEGLKQGELIQRKNSTNQDKIVKDKMWKEIGECHCSTLSEGDDEEK